MGNSESCLSPYRYEFEDPKVGDLDLSGTKVVAINDRSSAEAAEEYLRNKRILFVDCEGSYFGRSHQELGLVQVATGLDCCLVFHITKYWESLRFLKTLFESNAVKKVFHDCSGDSAILYKYGIYLSPENVDDTQIAHKMVQARITGKQIDQTTGVSLAYLYKHYLGRNIPGNKRFKKNPNPGGNVWIKSEDLSDRMVKYAVVDVLALCQIFAEQEGRFIRNEEYRALIKRKLESKIKYRIEGQNSRTTSQSFNWGGLLAAGAVTAVVLGAAVAASSSTGDEKKKNRKG